MTVNDLIRELQALANAGNGDLEVLADGEGGFYTPVVALDAHGDPGNPASEKYVRISPT